MNTKIFYSVFITTILVLFLSLGASLGFSSYQLIKADSEALTDYTLKLKKVIEENPDIDLTLLDIDQYRINLIHKDGTVYFDSQVKDNLENHANREEFVQAQHFGQSKVYRYSETLGKRTFYFAVRLVGDNILRCAYTTDNIISQAGSLAIHIFGILVVAVIMASILAFKISKSIVAPINEIDLNNPLANQVYPELEPLLQKISSHQKKIKKLLSKVTAAHERLKTMSSYMSEVIVFLNKRGEIILVNEAAKNLFKVNDDVIGGNLLSLSRENLFVNIYDNIDRDSFVRKDIKYENKYYHMIFNKIVSNNKLVGYVLLLIDNTKDKELELQRQEFASNVSHELKTPLQSIIGRAELIENKIVRPDDLPMFGQKIKDEGRALLSMINDIMFLSKIESGVKATTEKLNVLPLAQSVIDGLTSKAEDKGVKLNLNCEDFTFTSVRRYLTECLNNLVDNAIKYNKKDGTVDLTITHDLKKLYVSVKDTGLGIPQEDLPRIFERFFCVDRSHSNKDSTGLGLTIVKHIVKSLDGEITVDSTLGVGTEFKFELPLA